MHSNGNSSEFRYTSLIKFKKLIVASQGLEYDEGTYNRRFVRLALSAVAAEGTTIWSISKAQNSRWLEPWQFG